jgi:hypothetical protein
VDASSGVALPPNVHPASFTTPHSLPTMVADIFTRDGIWVRRLKSGRCVREDEWIRFVEINEVRSSTRFCCRSDVGLDLGCILYDKE